jgi:uncharacterized repeat protein (TIGR01451 family)
VITVTEINPAGYVSTGAVAGTNASKIDNDHLRISELVGGTTSSGNRFGDALPADLTVVKSVSPETAVAGSTLTYTLNYTNNGPSSAQGVTITDILPTEVVFGGVVSAAPPITLAETSPPTWYTPTLAADASGTIVFTVTVNPDASGTITNNVTITSTTFDAIPGNNDDEQATTINTQADLAISKSGNPPQQAAGLPLTYTLTYINNGPSDAQNVYITDTLPISVTFGGVVNEDPQLPSFTTDGQELTWYTPTLETGASGTIVFTVTVDPGASGSIITNSVTITSSTPDTNTGNNDADVQTPIGISTLATIYGTVFEDANGDGQQDAGESGISGVLLTLNDTTTTTTGLDGSYVLFTSQPFTYTVVETDPSGYSSTTPNEVHLYATLGNSYQVDFGDMLNTSDLGAIYGTVFEDTDGDGEWDADELGIPNVLITLDTTNTTTTDDYGSYTFSTTVESVHTVIETDPPG